MFEQHAPCGDLPTRLTAVNLKTRVMSAFAGLGLLGMSGCAVVPVVIEGNESQPKAENLMYYPAYRGDRVVYGYDLGDRMEINLRKKNDPWVTRITKATEALQYDDMPKWVDDEHVIYRHREYPNGDLNQERVQYFKIKIDGTGKTEIESALFDVLYGEAAR